MPIPYAATEPPRADIDALPGATLLEFGAPWCGICAALQPVLEPLLQQQTGLRHVKVEDGRGRPLGRSYGVKLWPTLIVLRDGQEVARLVRPQQAQAITDAIGQAQPLSR